MLQPEANADVVDAEASRVQVLFVGGMPRSGSTLLDLLLGQLPDHCDVGELFYMWESGILRDELCACGEQFSLCPFWTEVGKRAFGGWDRVDAAEVVQLQRDVDTTAKLPLFWARRVLPNHRAKVERYLDLTRSVYEAVAETAGAGVVVDSTKRPSTAYLLASDQHLKLRVVQIVRDPRGVINAWSRKVPLPAGAGPRDHLKQRPMRQILRRWMTVNWMIGRLGHRGVPLAVLRYEDLVEDPRAAMRTALELSGHEARDGDLDYIAPEGVRTGVSHAPTGGRVRFRTGPMPLKLDEKWRAEMPRSRQFLTKLLCRPLMSRYGYR